MPTAVGELKRILGDLKTKYNAEMSAIVSRSGIPIAWNLPENVHVENFATLSATLMGASEVIYTGMNRGPPRRVVVESENGTLIASGVGSKAFLVVLSSSRNDELLIGMEDAAKSIKEVLKTQP